MTDECYLDDEADRGREPESFPFPGYSEWNETWTTAGEAKVFRNNAAKLSSVKGRLQEALKQYPEPSVMIPVAFLHMFINDLMKLIED